MKLSSTIAIAVNIEVFIDNKVFVGTYLDKDCHLLHHENFVLEGV